jgi:TRAP transporter TAXI family solute receptor
VLVRNVRAVALALALFTCAGTLTGCQSQFPGLHLTIATGSSDGVYNALGTQLATSWANQLNIARPKVLETAGSPANIDRLRNGTADIGFADVDAAAVSNPDQGPRKLRALARIYDDYIQVVVRADLPIKQLSQLAGRRVSIGPANSQVQLVANRILAVGGVHGEVLSALSLNDAIAAMEAGTLDAFFWSGGMPTLSIASLNDAVPVRLLDLGADPSGVLQAMVDRFPVYRTAVVPTGTYGPGSAAVTTLVVANCLLVTDQMSNDVAQALVQGLFNATGELILANPAARAIDIHTAIFTDPVALHPGAEAYYRSTKS